MRGRFDGDIDDPFTDEDFDEDAEEIMESSQVSKTHNKQLHQHDDIICTTFMIMYRLYVTL